jgi:hypothetical protein
MNTVIRIIKHAESYEVRTSRFFYFDDNPGRRSISNRMSPKEAEEAAKALARTERDNPNDQAQAAGSAARGRQALL